jgi:hypothetical protein
LICAYHLLCGYVLIIYQLPFIHYIYIFHVTLTLYER